MSAKRALKNQERAYIFNRLRSFGQSSLLLSATVLSFLAVFLLATDYLYQPQRFTIESVKIKGKFRFSSPQQVEASLKDLDFGNFFSLELNAIKRHIEEMPWIARADIRRQWPDTLAINITEHRPVMLWQDNVTSQSNLSGDKQLWITSKADVIEVPNEVSTTAIGVRGNRHYAKAILDATLRWKTMLAAYDLTLLHVSQSETQSWRLLMRMGQDQEPFEVLLGSTQVEERLARFKYLFNEQFRFSNYQLQRVDARYPNGLAVKHVNREPLLNDEISEQS